MAGEYPNTPGGENFRAPRISILDQAFHKQRRFGDDNFSYAEKIEAQYKKIIQRKDEARDQVTSPDFQSYLIRQAEKGSAGPYCSALLRLMDSPEVRSIAGPDMYTAFGEMDTNFFHLTQAAKAGYLKWTYGEMDGTDNLFAKELAEGIFGMKHDEREFPAAINATFSHFKDASDTLVRAMTDKKNGRWRNFVLNNFPDIYSLIKYDGQVRTYNGDEIIQRLENLINSVPEEDEEFLMNYTFITSIDVTRRAAKILDPKIKDGDTEQAKAYFDTMLYLQHNVDVENAIPFEQFGWVRETEKIAEGEKTAEEVKRKIDSFKGIREAYSSLPDGLKDLAITFLHGDPDIPKKIQQEHFVTQLISELPTDEKRVQIAIDLFNGGLHPTSSLIDKLEDKPEIAKLLALANSTLFNLIEDKYKALRIVENWRIDNINLEDKDLNELHEDVNAITHILNKGYYPTPSLIGFFKENGDRAVQLCEEHEQLTREGKFSVNNVVQKDLEFVKFINTVSLAEATYQKFNQLPFIDITEGDLPAKLTPKEDFEAEVAAYEAANLFGFIKERKEMGRNVVVIGNMRYGEYFVLDPLKPYLKAEGVPTSTYYVRSSTSGMDEETFKLITQYVEKNSIDDVIIVDGTPSSIQSNTPRLPRSLKNYAERFEQEDYAVSHWVPNPTDLIYIGDTIIEHQSPTEVSPQVILANPVVADSSQLPDEYKGHSPGFFDDPEKYTKANKILALTKNGLDLVLETIQTEQDVVTLVQNRMMQSIGRHII